MSRIGNIVDSIRGQARNSSDPGAVLDAGWRAMQSADPRLAAAVNQMPPQVAQQVVLQYTNAIRLGKDADASNMAAQAAREGLAAYSQNQQGQQPRMRMGGGVLNNFKMNPQPRQQAPQLTDVAAFDKMLAPQQGPAAGIGASMQPAPAPTAQTFQGVRDTFQNYSMSGYSDSERNVAKSYGDQFLDKSKLKDLTVPQDWAPNTQSAAPRGLIIGQGKQ